jgi:hypothetical protein
MGKKVEILAAWMHHNFGDVSRPEGDVLKLAQA